MIRRARAGATALALALHVSLAVVAPPTPTASAHAGTARVTRVSGPDRVATAIAVARHGWPDGADRVLVATAGAFPDALAAGPLAAAGDAPILLSGASALPDPVLAEVRRLEPDEVVLVGGPGALARGIEQQLGGAGHAHTRIGGTDRYATAAAVAEALGPRASYVVASGETFADALSAASLPHEGAAPPTLLVRQASVPEATRDALATLGLDAGTEGVLLGGGAAVSEDVRQALPGAVERVAGSTRYGTARAAVERALDAHGDGPVRLLVASGADFPDALTVGALSARLGAPLLLVPRGNLGEELATFLREHRRRIGEVTVVGGPAAVSDVVVHQVERVLDGLPKDPVWLPDVAAARAYADARAGSVSFAAIGTDGELVGHRAGTVVPQASVLKVMFLTAYLRQTDVRDGALGAADRQLLEPMIRRSANEPATEIANRLGPSPMYALARDAGMNNFSYTRPWGRSTTSAHDQVRFMLDLESYLPPRHVDEALRLLTEVADEQRWGIGAVATPGWTVHFKGGWGAGTGAVEHQVAKLVHCGGTQVAVAVMTTDSPSHAYATETLEGVFRALLADLPAETC